jgi:hypothetical protein
MKPLPLTLLLLALASPARAQPAAAAPPTTAVAAIDRATAAYDYGDMAVVVDSARPVVDGALPCTPAQRQQALRLLGIGLYLTGRPAGAETAFSDLLRLSSRARLDPTTTRPEVVAFFEDVRRRHAAEIQDAIKARAHHNVLWNFLPPVGQFMNGTPVRGWIFLGLEAATLAGTVTTRAVLASWCHSDLTCPGHDAPTVRTMNFVFAGALAATWAAGVTDAFLSGGKDPEDTTLSLTLLPGGAALAGRF